MVKYGSRPVRYELRVPGGIVTCSELGDRQEVIDVHVGPMQPHSPAQRYVVQSGPGGSIVEAYLMPGCPRHGCNYRPRDVPPDVLCDMARAMSSSAPDVPKVVKKRIATTLDMAARGRI